MANGKRAWPQTTTSDIRCDFTPPILTWIAVSFFSIEEGEK